MRKILSESYAVIGQAHIDIVKCLKESSACNEAIKNLGQFFIADSKYGLANYEFWKAYREAEATETPPLSDHPRREVFHKKNDAGEVRQFFKKVNVDIVKHCSQKTQEIVRPTVSGWMDRYKSL